MQKIRLSSSGAALACALFLLLAGIGPTDVRAQTADEKVAQILAIQADADYGEYLASECLTCHQVSGATAGVPPIGGLPQAYLVRAMLDYKTGDRTNSIMQMMAGNLGDEELASLTLYVSELKK